MSTLSPAFIIDDDEFFRVAMDSVLRERFGVEKVEICETAEHAIAQLSNGTRFGLGLVDLNMPGVENRSFLGTLKALQPDNRLVVMSASKSRADILMALRAGAQGFINKGLGISETEVALRQIASGAVYLPPFTPQSADVGIVRNADDLKTHASLDSFTPRQMEVLELLVAGQPNKGIARSLDIHPSTVKFHLSIIFRILGTANRVEAALLGSHLLDERA